MQILHWLFKRPDDFSLAGTTPCGLSSVVCPGEAKRRALAVYNEVVSCEEDEEDAPTFTIVLRRQNSRTCFYSTLRLGHLRGLFKSEWRMGHCKAETTANVGCKVLPICDVVSTASKCSGVVGGDSGSDGSEKDAQRGERRRAVASRMKELLKWAAAAKSSRGGGSSGSKGWKALYFRHKAAALKAEADDSSSASSKMSFKWDAGSCSTASTVYSPISLPSTSRNDHAIAKNLSRLSVNLPSEATDPNLLLGSPKTEDYVRSGQWITTDSDFVVLEL